MFFPGDARSDVITWKCPGAFQSKCTKMEGLLKGGNRPVLYLSVGQGFVILVLLFFYQHLVIWSFTLHTQLLFLLLLVLHFLFLFSNEPAQKERTTPYLIRIQKEEEEQHWISFDGFISKVFHILFRPKKSRKFFSPLLSFFGPIQVIYYVLWRSTQKRTHPST